MNEKPIYASELNRAATAVANRLQRVIDDSKSSNKATMTVQQIEQALQPEISLLRTLGSDAKNPIPQEVIEGRGHQGGSETTSQAAGQR